MINKRRQGVINKAFIINIIKVLVCGVLAFVVAYVIDGYAKKIGSGTIITILRLCICAAPALIVYIGAGYVFKVTEIRFAFDKLLKRG